MTSGNFTHPWNHLRKKAGWRLRQIQHLYRVEARLREAKAGPKLREAVRAHENKPVVERLERALVLLKGSGRHLPQSLLGLTMDFALSQ